MDFGSVLYTAQKNDESSRQSNGWYKTGFAPPKKEQREKKLSVNIQKFLARKEAEEKLKKLEANRKKQELFALRNQDKKSVNRVQSMLKRTKSANKSVLEDAIDYDNTALTAAGPSQPDEDDYGYVSTYAQEEYNRIINKYQSVPNEDPFNKKSLNKTAKDITTTKDRVKAALQREEEEKMLPRKRKRKSKDNEANQVSEAEDSDDGGLEKIDEKQKPEKFKIPKKNAQAPPPIDFQSLLKLAEKKQHEPIIIEKPVEEKPDRPMTQKEKVEFLRERERKMRRGTQVQVTNDNKLSESGIKRVKFGSAVGSKLDVNKTTQKDNFESASKSIQKCSRAGSSALQSSQLGETRSLDLKKVPFTKAVRPDKPKAQKEKLKSHEAAISNGKPKADADDNELRDKSKSQLLNDKKKTMLMKRAREQYYAQQRRKITTNKLSTEFEDLSPVKMIKKPPDILEYRDAKSTERKALPHSSNVKKVVSGETVREFPPRDMRRPNERSREFPPRDTVRLNERSREFPPRDTIRQFPPSDMMRKKSNSKPVRRRVIESDDEYDSEMDDFIDDSEDTNDYSKHISEIFGYDRSKWIDEEDDDDECMESNFADLQKEEYKSLISGITEDLADVRRTKLEKQLKKKRMLSRY